MMKALAITSTLGVLSIAFAFVAFGVWGQTYRSAALGCCTFQNGTRDTSAACYEASTHLVWAVAGTTGSSWYVMSSGLIGLMFCIVMAFVAADLKQRFNSNPDLATLTNAVLVCAAFVSMVLLAYAVGNASRPLESLWDVACPDKSFPTTARTFAVLALACWAGATFTGHYINPDGTRYTRTRKSEEARPLTWFVLVLLAVVVIMEASRVSTDVQTHGNTYTDAIGTCCASGAPSCSGAKALLKDALFDSATSPRKIGITALALAGVLLISMCVVALVAHSVAVDNRHVFAASALLATLVTVALSYVMGSAGGDAMSALWKTAACTDSVPVDSWSLILSVVSVGLAMVVGHCIPSPLHA